MVPNTVVQTVVQPSCANTIVRPGDLHSDDVGKRMCAKKKLTIGSTGRVAAVRSL